MLRQTRHRLLRQQGRNMSTLKTVKTVNIGTASNPVYDIEIINGKTTMLYDADALTQILNNKLRTWLGEWFADTTVGIDYLGLFNQKTFLDRRFALLVRGILTDDARISSINSLEVAFDRTTRTISATFKATSIYGEVSGTI
jgi:hypothetical protein